MPFMICRSQLPLGPGPTPSASQGEHTPPNRHHLPSPTPPTNIRVYTWNVGGLGGGLYDEILYYIHQHSVDVLMLQETKWRFSSSWDTHQYIFVHSGSREPDLQGGLLTVVAKRLLDPGTLRYVDVIPGRLLRLQFHRHSQPCDLLNFYQHTWRRHGPHPPAATPGSGSAHPHH